MGTNAQEKVSQPAESALPCCPSVHSSTKVRKDTSGQSEQGRAEVVKTVRKYNIRPRKQEFADGQP